MSVDTWKLEKDLCRCCHSEGAFKNLAEPFKHLGQEEIYSEMLQECLDINLNPVAGPLSAVTYKICEECILRIREACSFKQQVLDCEQRFHDLYGKKILQLTSFSDKIEVKKEVPDIELEEDTKGEIHFMDNEDNGLGVGYNDDVTDHKTPLLEIDIKSEVPKKSRQKKAKTKERAKDKAKKKVGRPRKVKEEGERSEQKKGRKATAKFRLHDEDYTRNGDMYLCSRCDKRYDKIFSLKFHVKTKHYKIPRFPCPYCKEEFMTPAPLTIHKLAEHNKDERFKCNACKGTFNTKVQLRKHINNFHMMGEKYKCEFCDYESFSFEGMYKHKFKHKTVKDYHCRFCRKAFLRKTTLDLHERIHTGDRRKVCSVCSKAFVQKASLNYHMTKYHPEVNF